MVLYMQPIESTQKLRIQQDPRSKTLITRMKRKKVSNKHFGGMPYTFNMNR
jgi:hypothetical protein